MRCRELTKCKGGIVGTLYSKAVIRSPVAHGSKPFRYNILRACPKCHLATACMVTTTA